MLFAAGHARFAPPVSGLELQLDTIVSGTASVNNGSTTSALSITIGNNSNRLLIVNVSEQSPSGNTTVSGITIGGQALTRAVRVRQGLLESECWYILNPPSGAQTITITYTGLVASNTLVVQGAYSIFNADQASGINLNNLSINNASDSSNPNTQITPSASNSWLIDNVVQTTTSILSSPSDWSQWNTGNSSVETGASQLKTSPIVGNNTLSWTSGSAATAFASLAIEVLASRVEISITDVTSLQDSITKSKTIQDTILLIESFIPNVGKIITDTTALSDSVSKNINKASTDFTTLTDLFQRVSKTATPSDAITLTDSITKSIKKVVSDAMISQIFNFDPNNFDPNNFEVDTTFTIHLGNTVLLISDTLNLNDTASKGVIKAVLDDTHMTDTIKKMVGKAITDTTTLTDSTTKARFKPITMSDTTSLLDSVVKHVFKVISDNTLLADTVLRQKTITGITLSYIPTMSLISNSIINVELISTSPLTVNLITTKPLTLDMGPT